MITVNSAGCMLEFVQNTGHSTAALSGNGFSWEFLVGLLYPNLQPHVGGTERKETVTAVLAVLPQKPFWNTIFYQISWIFCLSDPEFSINFNQQISSVLPIPKKALPVKPLVLGSVPAVKWTTGSWRALLQPSVARGNNWDNHLAGLHETCDIVTWLVSSSGFPPGFVLVWEGLGNKSCEWEVQAGPEVLFYLCSWKPWVHVYFICRTVLWKPEISQCWGKPWSWKQKHAGAPFRLLKTFAFDEEHAHFPVPLPAWVFSSFSHSDLHN